MSPLYVYIPSPQNSGFPKSPTRYSVHLVYNCGLAQTARRKKERKTLWAQPQLPHLGNFKRAKYSDHVKGTLKGKNTVTPIPDQFSKRGFENKASETLRSPERKMGKKEVTLNRNGTGARYGLAPRVERMPGNRRNGGIEPSKIFLKQIES